jgi:hypothetical protein
MIARLVCGIAAILVIASVAKMVVTGKTGSYYGEKFIARREAEPFQYWILVAFYLALGLFLGWLAISST